MLAPPAPPPFLCPLYLVANFAAVRPALPLPITTRSSEDYSRLKRARSAAVREVDQDYSVRIFLSNMSQNYSKLFQANPYEIGLSVNLISQCREVVQGVIFSIHSKI